MPRREFLGMVALAVAACGPTASAPPTVAAVDTAAVTQAVTTLLDRAAAADNAGDPAAYAALFTETARMDFPGYPPMIGKAAIAAAATTDFAQNDYDGMTLTAGTTVVVNGALVYTSGTFSGTVTPKGGGPMAMAGRYAGAAVRDSSGAWLYQYLIAFPDSVVAKK